MDTNAEKIIAEALTLPAEARAFVAEKLIESLDALTDTEVERLWLDEAERRYQAYKSDRLPARPAEDVLRDARASLQ